MDSDIQKEDISELNTTERIIVEEFIFQALDNFTIPVKTEENKSCFVDIASGDPRSISVEIRITFLLPKHMFQKCWCHRRASLVLLTFNNYILRSWSDIDIFEDDYIFDVDGIDIYYFDELGFLCDKHYYYFMGYEEDDDI